MKNISALILCILSSLMFTSCKPALKVTEETDKIDPPVQVTMQSNPIPTMEPYVFKTSEPGMVTIHGWLLVMDPTVMLPDPNDGIFLVPLSNTGEGISTIPSFDVGDVPQADVDERTGEFVFINVQPGQYGVVVLTMGDAQVPARVHKDGSLAIIQVKESDQDNTIELEYLQLP